MDLELNGKKAIVTGGSRGLGKAIARVLAEEGVNIAIVARGRKQLEATATELGVIPFVADTGDDGPLRDWV